MVTHYCADKYVIMSMYGSIQERYDFIFFAWVQLKTSTHKTNIISIPELIHKFLPRQNHRAQAQLSSSTTWTQILTMMAAVRREKVVERENSRGNECHQNLLVGWLIIYLFCGFIIYFLYFRLNWAILVFLPLFFLKLVLSC